MNPLSRVARPRALSAFLVVVLASFATGGAAFAAGTELSRVVAEGRIAPYPGAEVTLSLDLAGTLEAVAVEEKQPVKKGSVVARLRVDDLKAALAEAKARVAESEADVRLFEVEVTRAEKLVADRVESVQNLDRARRNRDAGAARLTTAQASVRRREAEIAKSILVSPISGVVTERLADSGEGVRAGQAILTVVDLHRLRVEAEVDEFDAHRVTVGTAVVVKAEGYPGSWRAKVEEIPDTVARRSVRPQDDLYRFAGGAWLANTPIPADKSNYGSFIILDDKATEEVKELILAASQKADRPPGSDAQKIGDFYQAYMDTARVESLGLEPLKQEFARIDAIATPRDVARYIGYSQRIGVAQPFAWFSAPDSKNSSVYLGSLAADVATAGARHAERSTAEWMLYGAGFVVCVIAVIYCNRLARRALARYTAAGAIEGELP